MFYLGHNRGKESPHAYIIIKEPKSDAYYDTPEGNPFLSATALQLTLLVFSLVKYIHQMTETSAKWLGVKNILNYFSRGFHSTSTIDLQPIFGTSKVRCCFWSCSKQFLHIQRDSVTQVQTLSEFFYPPNSVNLTCLCSLPQPCMRSAEIMNTHDPQSGQDTPIDLSMKRPKLEPPPTLPGLMPRPLLVYPWNQQVVRTRVFTLFR